MNYSESVQYLFSLGRELAAPSHARALKFDLANIRALVSQMRNPEAQFHSIHVAGTNGKGSTAAMIESVLRAAGIRTGLYTSPHLERINERIRVAGQEISDAAFAGAFSRLHALIELMLSTGALAAHPTFFECLTAMAFDVFARANVEIAVLEVGMGGRLDATNVVTPEICVITQIAFDHESFLGHSIEQIAAEKAGIIKPGIPVVTSAEDSVAREVIRRRAAELSAPVVETDDAYRVELIGSDTRGSRARVSSRKNDFDATIAVPLPGKFQVRNAVTALAAVRLLAQKSANISDIQIIDGIARVRWPGRLEQISSRPDVFLDGTHNPAGARELAAFLDDNFAGRPIFLVFGAVRDKSIDEIAELLLPRATKAFITAPKNSRAISPAILAEMTHGLARDLQVAAEPSEALALAISAAGPNGVVIATGSLYLVGDLRRWWFARTAGASVKSGANPSS
jgi:dihydrofolate synthase / folylpolyglutamate synthase